MVSAPFAQLLRRQRRARGLTQQELAERAHISERAISDLERGIKTLPRLTTVRLLIEALCLDSEEAFALRAAAQLVDTESQTRVDELSLPSARAYAEDPQLRSNAADVSHAPVPSGPLFDIHYARRADGAATAYGTTGSGPVLLMPPGFISHLEWWGTAPGSRTYLQRLSERRTVVLYDRHGCGLSDRDRTVFTLEDDMQDIEAVAEAVGGHEVDLLGSSFGSRPAILYAARHPERVRRLVLYGGTGARPTRVTEMSVRAIDAAHQIGVHDAYSDRRAAMAALRRADLELFVRAVAMQVFPSGVAEETFRNFVHVFRIAATPEMQEGLETVSFDLDPVLPTITTPTLVLHRRGDQAAPFADGQDLARRIPGARFVPLEGDAHFEWVGDCQSVVTPMLEFILGESSHTVEY